MEYEKRDEKMKNKTQPGNPFFCCISFVFLTLFLVFSCSLFTGNREDGTPGDIVIDPPEEQNQGQEIIIKVDTSVPLPEIDRLVPGIRQKNFTFMQPTKGEVRSRYVVYTVNEDNDPDIVLMSLMTSGKVYFAEKSVAYSLYVVPNDPYYAYYQYAPRITHCEEAWDITRGDATIVAAVLDTGINGNHEDIGTVLGGRNIIAGEDIPPHTNSDNIGHGTHVAGIIGATGNNGIGIAGVAWNIELMPVKIFEPGFNTTSAHVAEGIIWAVDNGADVINMSIGSGLYSIAVHDAVNYAHEHNVVLVGGMGNDYRHKVAYPAALPGVIAVGASNGRDEIAFFSTRGDHMSVAAPGESIYSLGNSSDNHYFYASGTSMATPFVTGTVGLLLSYRPSLIPEQVRSIIEDAADPLGPDEFSPEYGHGRVNVYNTLNLPERNNYASITVNVMNNGEPIGGVKVLVQDNTNSVVIQSGITSYGGGSGSVNGQVVFNHIRFGDYKVRVQIGEPQDQDVILSVAGENRAVSFDFAASMTLIVNAIKIMNNSLLTSEFLYMQKLSAMGKFYTTWKTAYHGPPPSSLVNAYDTVIWFTGRTMDDPDNFIQVMTDREVTVLRNYLDNGGRLFLCGSNIAESLSAYHPAFLTDYLHASYLSSPLSHDELAGNGFLTGMYLVLNMVDEDQIGLEAGATGILDSSDEAGTHDWAGLSWENGYRLVFTSIAPNDILFSMPNTFFEDTINWLEQIQ